MQVSVGETAVDQCCLVVLQDEDAWLCTAQCGYGAFGNAASTTEELSFKFNFHHIKCK